MCASRRREILVWSLCLYAAWAVTFFAFKVAVQRWPVLGGRGPATLFWAVCKLLVWVMPVCLLVRRRAPNVLHWLGLDAARGLARGAAATAIFLLMVALLDTLIPGRWPKPLDLQADDALTLLLITLYGPFVEELLFRGYVLRALVESGSPFWRANVQSTLLFTLLHLPGWFFMGRPLGECFVLAPQIAFGGFLFGSLRFGNIHSGIQSISLWPCVVMHVCNNAWRAGWFVMIADLGRQGLP